MSKIFTNQIHEMILFLALNVKKKLPRDPPPNQQQTVIPSQASGGSSNSGGRQPQPPLQSTRFGSSNPPPDVLNTGAHVNAGGRVVENDPNITLATTVTSTSMGRGMYRLEWIQRCCTNFAT